MINQGPKIGETHLRWIRKACFSLCCQVQNCEKQTSTVPITWEPEKGCLTPRATCMEGEMFCISEPAAGYRRGRSQPKQTSIPLADFQGPSHRIPSCLFSSDHLSTSVHAPLEQAPTLPLSLEHTVITLNYLFSHGKVLILSFPFSLSSSVVFDFYTMSLSHLSYL